MKTRFIFSFASTITLSLFMMATEVAHAADASYFKFSDVLSADTVKEYEKAGVKLYWGAEATPEFAEVARPDTYTSSSISLSPFGGSSRHCVDAFQRALKSLVDDARTRGYDAVLGLQVMREGKPSGDEQGFYCKPGYKTTEVPIMGTFAMSAAALQRMNEADEQSLKQPAREAAKGAIFLPLEPLLSSAEAKAILGGNINAHIMSAKAPAYKHRYGPDEYYDEADPRVLGNEAACKQAVLNALKLIVQDAQQRQFNTIIKIRSYLNSQFAPIVTDVECLLSKKSAGVSLQASLANVQ